MLVNPYCMNICYWWFAYDIIKNIIMEIMIDLSQILIWHIKRVSVPNLKSFGQTKTEVRAKEVEEFSVTLHAGLPLSSGA